MFEEYGPYAHIYSPDLFTASAGYSCDCVPPVRTLAPRSFGSKLGARKKSAARSRSPLVIVLLASLACLLAALASAVAPLFYGIIILLLLPLLLQDR